MSKREEKRKAYGEGWDTWNADLLLSSLTDDFVFDDPAMPEPVIKANMEEYMAGWEDRVKQRLTCELVIGDRNHQGIVLDLSKTGLFIQTSASPPDSK